MWLLPFLYQKMCTWVLVYIPNHLYSKNSLFPHFRNSAKLHRKVFPQHFFIPTLHCFSTLFKTSLVLTLLSILLGCCLSPIQLKTFEKHWTVAIFFLEICKTETFLSCFYWYNKQNSKLSHHAFSFCVYYKAASIWKQIKR